MLSIRIRFVGSGAVLRMPGFGNSAWVPAFAGTTEGGWGDELVASVSAQAYLAQLSFSVVTRLNTGTPGFESTRSATK